MLITYPHHIRWKLFLDTHIDPYDFFIGSMKKRVKKTVEKLQQQNVYEFRHEIVTKEYIERFLPIYQELISSKENPLVFDIASSIVLSDDAKYKYESVSLYQNDIFVGGVIYSNREDSFFVGYKAFPRTFDFSAQSTPTKVAEYYLIQKAQQEKKEYMSHGKDRNRYGLYSSIGLAQFKMSIGCLPYVEEKTEIYKNVSFESSVNTDVLVFLGDTINERITQAILFSSQDETTAKKAYPELWRVDGLEIIMKDIEPFLQ